jgi:hypothetical protein
MPEYAASFLVKNPESSGAQFYLPIPKSLYDIGTQRYRRIWLCLSEPKDQGLFDDGNVLTFFLTPYRHKAHERIFYISVDIKSEPNTLARVITLLSALKINILECRSVDRTVAGLAEFIVNLPEDLFKSLGENPDESLSKMISERAREGAEDGPLFDSNVVCTRPLTEQEVQTLGNFERYLSRDAFDPKLIFKAEIGQKHEYKLEIPAPEAHAGKEIYDHINRLRDGNYVSLIYDPRSNIMQAVFKDSAELMVEIMAELEDRAGQLARLISPLGAMEVDLRLIKPVSVSEAVVGTEKIDIHIYQILANIRHTRLSLFESGTIEEILRASSQIAPGDAPNFRVHALNDGALGGLTIRISEGLEVDRTEEIGKLVEPPSGVWLVSRHNAGADWKLRVLHFFCYSASVNRIVVFRIDVMASAGAQAYFDIDGVARLVESAFSHSLLDAKAKTIETLRLEVEKKFYDKVSAILHSIYQCHICLALSRQIRDIGRQYSESQIQVAREAYREIAFNFRIVKNEMISTLRAGGVSKVWLHSGDGRYQEKDIDADLQSDLNIFCNQLKIFSGEALRGTEAAKWSELWRTADRIISHLSLNSAAQDLKKSIEGRRNIPQW